MNTNIKTIGDLGTDLPDGTCINSFGDIMVLDEDGRNYRIIGKVGKN